MKILFQRRSVSYSITKSEVTRVVRGEELDSIFGETGDIFYNTEIQGPSASNVVNYDANVLSIHPTGHKRYNKV